MFIIRNAKLKGKDELVDILIEDGKFKEIEERIKGEFKEEIDVRGNLVSPPFVEPHVHLDATLTVGTPRYNESGTLLEGIEIWGERKKTITKEEIKRNALETTKWLMANGVLHIRTHVDTTEKSLITVQALLELKEEMKEYVDIQIVAFPQDGIFSYKNMDKLLEKAVQMGVDAIGGIPHVEITREDGVKSMEYVFNLAKKYNKLIDIHTDETGDDQSRFLEVVAKLTLENEMEGSVTASHTTAMHNYNNDYALKLIGILKRADINIVANPSSNALIQNRRDGYPRRRGITRVDELIERGVNVSIGNDDIMDPFAPLGKGNMLQAAHLLAHMGHLSNNKDLSRLFDMITFGGAKTLSLQDYGIKIGNSANFIVLDAKDEREAIRLTSEVLYAFKDGNMLVKTRPAKRNLMIENKNYDIDFKI